MLNVTLSPEAQSTLDNLADEDREDVRKWCKELRAWRPDKFFSRTVGIELGRRDKLYMLKTDNEIRLMFRANTKAVHISEIIPTDAVRQRMLSKARRAGRAKVAQAS